MTATEPTIDQDRLRRICLEKGADPDVALWIVSKAVQEFPDPDGEKWIDGARFGRVSYGRSLAVRTCHGWTVGLVDAVREFLKGE